MAKALPIPRECLGTTIAVIFIEPFRAESDKHCFFLAAVTFSQEIPSDLLASSTLS